jgi:hypothetical protein
MPVSKTTREALKSVLEFLCAEEESHNDSVENKATFTLQSMHFNNLAVNLKMPIGFASARLNHTLMHLPEMELMGY